MELMRVLLVISCGSSRTRFTSFMLFLASQQYSWKVYWLQKVGDQKRWQRWNTFLSQPITRVIDFLVLYLYNMLHKKTLLLHTKESIISLEVFTQQSLNYSRDLLNQTCSSYVLIVIESLSSDL